MAGTFSRVRTNTNTKVAGWAFGLVAGPITTVSLAVRDTGLERPPDSQCPAAHYLSSALGKVQSPVTVVTVSGSDRVLRT